MDIKLLVILTAVAGGIYIILTILEKILIKKKTKKVEVVENDRRTSDRTDTVANENE